MTYHPFKVTKEDVERSSTMDKSDIGRWAIIMHGCFMFVSGPDPINLDSTIPNNIEIT